MYCRTHEDSYDVWWRYGDDAGQATDTALQSVVNVGVTAFNIDNLGIKAILGTTGKKAAKVMLKSSDEEAAEGEQMETQTPEAHVEAVGTDAQNKEMKEEEKK